MRPFEILLLAGVADVKLPGKPGLNIYKLGFMLKNGQNTIFFLPFLPSKQSFCLSFTLLRPKRRARVRSKIITRLERRQFIHVFKDLKQGLKGQDKGTISRFYNMYFMSCKAEVSSANRNICNFYKI